MWPWHWVIYEAHGRLLESPLRTVHPAVGGSAPPPQISGFPCCLFILLFIHSRSCTQHLLSEPLSSSPGPSGQSNVGVRMAKARGPGADAAVGPPLAPEHRGPVCRVSLLCGFSPWLVGEHLLPSSSRPLFSLSVSLSPNPPFFVRAPVILGQGPPADSTVI